MIPKAIRDGLGLKPGDAVVFVPEEGGVRVEPAQPTTELAGKFTGIGLTAELEAEHRREVKSRR